MVRSSDVGVPPGTSSTDASRVGFPPDPGTEPVLAGRSVDLNQRAFQVGQAGEFPAAQRVRNFAVHVADSLANAKAAEAVAVAIAQLMGFARPGRRARR